MNEVNGQLLNSARAYVTDIYTRRVKPEFVFHNLEHTEDVVEACSHMADYYQLSEDDRIVLMLAAWFHDTGYSTGNAEGHEQVSTELATQFLKARNADDALVQRVGSCIEATRMPQSPVSLIEKILCDADLSHLASDDYKARNQLLKQERENLLGHKIDKKLWKKNNVKFLMNHNYYTEYGEEMLKAKKMENLAIFEKKNNNKVAGEAPAEEEFPYKSENNEKKAAQDQKNAERGIQTMFRTTSNNHIELSGMADNKAHIMITVNSIILSVTMTYLLAEIAYRVRYWPATGILVFTCLISIIFSILATRPFINKGKFTEEDIRNKKTNLLFFGNFHEMELADYQWGMQQMLKDKEYLYNTMTMDIYYLGIVLAKKYKYLRISYTVFMVGLVLAVIAFGIGALVPDPPQEMPPTRIDF